MTFCVSIQLLVQHCNVDMRIGTLRWALATSEIHRFHHRNRAELGDVNFGLFFTLWDHLLGTYHYEQRDRRFESEDLGIADRPDYPIGYREQLLEPFIAPAS